MRYVFTVAILLSFVFSVFGQSFKLKLDDGTCSNQNPDFTLEYYLPPPAGYTVYAMEKVDWRITRDGDLVQKKTSSDLVKFGSGEAKISFTGLPLGNYKIKAFVYFLFSTYGFAQERIYPYEKTFTVGVVKPTISGPSAMCFGDTLFSVKQSIAMPITYTWNVPTGFLLDGVVRETFQSTALSATVGVPEDVMASRYQISVTATGCGTKTEQSTRFVEVGPNNWFTIEDRRFGLSQSSHEFSLRNIAFGIGDYDWEVFDGIQTQRSTRSDVRVTFTGTYQWVKVRYNNGCGWSNYKVLSFGSPPVVTLYPNVANSIVTVATPEADELQLVSVKNSNGSELIRLTPATSETTFDVVDLPDGVYYVTIKTLKNVTISRLVVKK